MTLQAERLRTVEQIEAFLGCMNASMSNVRFIPYFSLANKSQHLPTANTLHSSYATQLPGA